MDLVNGNNVSASEQQQVDEDHGTDDWHSPLKGEEGLEIRRHDEVKDNINKIFMRQLYVYTSYCVTFYSRTNIFILFCETLDGYKNDDTWLLGLFVYLSYVSSALMSIGFGSIGDRWRFDYLLLIAALFDIITFWIEATATNIYTIGIAYAVGGQPFVSIIASWNLKVNQLYYAKQYASTMHIVATIGSLLGACAGSILANYFNYRLVFYIAACLACVQFLYCFVFFWDSQTKIAQQTLSLKKYYDKYPITSAHDENNTNLSTKKVAINNYNTFVMMNENTRWKISKDYRFPGGITSPEQIKKDETLWQMISQINKYTLFLISLFYFLCSAIFANEAAIITYYSAYIVHTLNGTLLISGSQIGLYCIGNLIACAIVKEIVAYAEKQKTTMQVEASHDQVNVRYDLTNLLVLAGFICIIINFIISVILLDTDTNGGYFIQFWIFMPIYGITTTVGWLVYLMIVYQISPSNIAGFLTGIRNATIYGARAIICLLIGIMWNYSNHAWFWYFQILSSILAFIACIIVVICESFRRNKLM